MLNIALPKGRLGRNIYDIFDRAGYKFPEILDEGRKLYFTNSDLNMRCFWVKPYDVPVYVERGAADVGVSGKDILLETEPDIYELCDLHTGKCTIAAAAPENFIDDGSKTLTVATEYPNIAEKYYRSLGRKSVIVGIRGSAEIAPLLGLSDVIVDVVETGTTLRENGLKIIAEICTLSARFIANKSSFKFNSHIITQIIRRLQALNDKDNISTGL